MAGKVRVSLAEGEVDERIGEVAAKINGDYAEKRIRMICILEGEIFFTRRLAKRMTVPVSPGFTSVSNYGSSTVSGGVVEIVKDLDEFLENKDMLVMRDIIDSGHTLAYLIEVLEQRGPEGIHLYILLDKLECGVKR